MGQVVLVTGVAGELARRFARQLADHDRVDRVIGVDITPPRGDLGAAHFVRADIRNPVIAKVIVRERVDTVVHAMVAASDPHDVGRTALKELNVIGTMQLLAACQQAPDVRGLVVKSHAAVYGASSRDPAMFTEQMSAKRTAATGFVKDITEVEGYTRGFARRRPDVNVTTLRMTHVVGPDVQSALLRYLRMPVVPTVLGFDPRLQFLHESDALRALEHATVRGVPGTFNITGDGVVTLSQAVRRLGRVACPMPARALSSLGGVLNRTQHTGINREFVSYLTFGRGMDNSRMRTQLRFSPAYTTESAFEDFAASVNPGLASAHRVRALESALSARLHEPAPVRTDPLALEVEPGSAESTGGAPHG